MNERLPAVQELAPAERGRLAELEAVVERGLQTFVEVGLALTEIRDRRLYRETHATFDDYCRQRWDFARAHAYRLIDGARVAEAVSPIGDIANEAQARELVPVLRDAGEAELVETWCELRDEYGDEVTAERIRRLVADRNKRERREQAHAAEVEARREQARRDAVAGLGPPRRYTIYKTPRGWLEAELERVRSTLAHARWQPPRSWGHGYRYGPYKRGASGLGVPDEVASVPGVVDALERLEAAWRDLEGELQAAGARVGEQVEQAAAELARLAAGAPAQPF